MDIGLFDAEELDPVLIEGDTQAGAGLADAVVDIDDAGDLAEQPADFARDRAAPRT